MNGAFSKKFIEGATWVSSLLKPIKPMDITKIRLNVKDIIITVLVVQSDPAQRALLSEAIRMVTGLDAITAPTQEGALARFDASDVLLIDCRLSGHVSIRLILEEWFRKNKGPICVLSSSTIDQDAREDLYHQGVSHVLSKDVSNETIISVLRLYEQEAKLRRVMDVSVQREMYLIQYTEMITLEVQRLKQFVPFSLIIIAVLFILLISDTPLSVDSLLRLLGK